MRKIKSDLFENLMFCFSYRKRKDLLLTFLFPFSIFLIISGVYGITLLPKSISKDYHYWYFKTIFEPGLFFLIFIHFYVFIEKFQSFFNRLKIITDLSFISLTLYIIEVILSEVLRKIFMFFNHSIFTDMGKTFLFGFFNLILWILIIYIWNKKGFKYTFKCFLIKLFLKLNLKLSTKLNP